MDGTLAVEVSRDKVRDKILPYLLFFIWPFFSLIYAIANWRSPWAKNIAWLFCGFFGFTFYIPPDGPDANRYRDYLIYFHHSGVDLWQYIPEVLMGKHGKGDMLEPLLRGVIGYFTDDHRILFCAFGLIMGYFLTRSVWFLLDHAGGKISPYAYLFLGMVAFGIGIWQINGFRFWTASYIFIYGCIVFLLKKKRFLGTMFFLLSVATHITFIFAVFAFFASFLLSRYPKSLLVVFALSLVYANTPVEVILEQLPEKLFVQADRYVKGYLHSDVVKNLDKIRTSQAWFIKLNSLAANYFFSFLIILYSFFNRQFKFLSKGYPVFLALGTVILGLNNIFNLVPSFARFAVIGYILISIFYFSFLQQTQNALLKKIIGIAAIIPLSLFLVIQWRLGLSFIGLSPLLTSPMFAWLMDALPAFM